MANINIEAFAEELFNWCAATLSVSAEGISAPSQDATQIFGPANQSNDLDEGELQDVLGHDAEGRRRGNQASHGR